MKYRTGPSPDPGEGPSAVLSGTSPTVPCDLGVTQVPGPCWAVLGRFLPLWEGRDSALKDPGEAQRAPPLGLPDLANKNTGHPAEVEFQTDMNSFSVCLWATVHQCQAGGPGDNSRFCWLFPRGGGRPQGRGSDLPCLRVFQPQRAHCTLRLQVPKVVIWKGPNLHK